MNILIKSTQKVNMFYHLLFYFQQGLVPIRFRLPLTDRIQSAPYKLSPNRISNCFAAALQVVAPNATTNSV